MMKKKTLLILMSLVLAAAGGLSGCGAGDSTAEAASSAASGAETSTDEGASESDGGTKTSGRDISQTAAYQLYHDAYEVPLVEETATLDNIDDFAELGDLSGLTASLYHDDSADVSSYPDMIGRLVGYRVSYDEAALGTTVTMDYVGTIDGTAFEGGSAENADLELGSGSFIDDFEDQLVGARPGDTVEVHVTFPETYQSEELQGKDAVFTCTIHAVWQNFWDAVIAAVTVRQLPQSIYDLMLETVQANYEQLGANYGMTGEQYREAIGAVQTMEQEARQEAKWVMANLAVLKSLGVTQDSDVYREMETNLLSLSGYETMADAEADGLTAEQVGVSVQYYLAMTELLKSLAMITG